MLRIDNLAEVLRGIDDWVDTVEELAEDTYRGLAVQAFKYIVQGTPEWTGNLAASWRLTIGAPAQGYDETPFKELELGGLPVNPAPFSRQSPNQAALNYAYSIAKFQLPFIRLGADLFITNNAPYAMEVETDTRRSDGKVGFIRQVNRPIEMVHAAHDKFNALGEITTAKALDLGKERL